MASKLRSSSPTAGWRSRLRPLRGNLTLCEAQCWRNSSLWVESLATRVMGLCREGCGLLRAGAWRRRRWPCGRSRRRTLGRRVEVDEPGGVGGAFGCRAGDGGVQDRRVERAGERVHGKDVVPGVADPGWCFSDRVENLLDDGADRGRPGPGAPLRGWAGGAG